MEKNNGDKKVRPILNRIKTIGDLRSKKTDESGSSSPVASPRLYNKDGAHSADNSAPSSPDLTSKKLARGKSFWQARQKDEFDEALQQEKERDKEMKEREKEREKEKKRAERQKKRDEKKSSSKKAGDASGAMKKRPARIDEESYVDDSYPTEAIDEECNYDNDEEYDYEDEENNSGEDDSKSESSEGEIELVDEDGDAIDASKKKKFKKNLIKWVSMFSYFPAMGVAVDTTPRSPTITALQSQRRRGSLCLN